MRLDHLAGEFAQAFRQTDLVLYADINLCCPVRDAADAEQIGMMPVMGFGSRKQQSNIGALARSNYDSQVFRAQFAEVRFYSGAQDQILVCDGPHAHRLVADLQRSRITTNHCKVPGRPGSCAVRLGTQLATRRGMARRKWSASHSCWPRCSGPMALRIVAAKCCYRRHRFRTSAAVGSTHAEQHEGRPRWLQ
jgi:hypothetical protein